MNILFEIKVSYLKRGINIKYAGKYKITMNLKFECHIFVLFLHKLSFIYPPREHKKTLQDGFIANAAFEKENVEKKLKDKVRRSNNLVVEIQGAVIVTSK